jgi:hypothetical protein
VLMEVTNTYEDKSTGELMATSMCVGDRERVYDLKDVRLRHGKIMGEGGIGELIVSYGQSRTGSAVP